MRQSTEERREHHQTREDRQRKAYDVLQCRIRDGLNGRTRLGYNIEAAMRDAARLAAKLNIT